jgi:SlyX protein
MTTLRARVTELEIRFTHQQDTIDQLSDVVASQGRLIQALRAEVEVLKRQHVAVLEALKPPPADERPPHYER